MSRRLIKLIATFGGLGYSKIAPGTTGCLGAALLYLAIRQNTLLYISTTTALVITGFLISGKAEDIIGRKDARPIVIDDACGLLIALLFIPFSYPNLLLVFLIFRTLDIIKPFPIKRVEGLAGSAGIMADDILAGIYSNLVFRFALPFFQSWFPMQ